MAFIKLYEWFVLTAVLLCEVSSVTSEVYSVRSWGDPHITTVDRVEYDFNGHGEYIFLQTGNTTVQVRADYVTPGNKDSTIFVAVAIKADIGLFEAQLNQTSGVVTVYKDGVAVCSSNDSPPQGVPSNSMFPCGLSSTSNRPVRGVLVGNGKVLFGLKGFGSYLKALTLQGGSDISITLEGIKDNISHSNLNGLAGGSVNIKAKNGTLFRVSNLLDMFDFGESLRISENESLFNYSLSSGDYSTYNTFSRPMFYEDNLTNLTALFNLNGHQHNDLDINEFDKTCNESKVRDKCLLAIARSDDIWAGEAVNMNYLHEQYLYDMKRNTPPYFTDEIPVLNVYLADNHSVILNLSYYVHDNNIGDILTFLVETNLPKTHFMLDSVSGFFNWTVLPSLRHMNASIKIMFTVHDRFNSTIFRDVEVKFCGCNKTSQCDKQHSDTCHCQIDKYVMGYYCEIRQDPCTVTTCFNQSMCNGDNITDDTGPCALCPKGRYNDFQSDTQICHDVDECDSKYDGNDKCDVNSNCTNTDGSYTCTCHHGYRLMSNGYKCEDEDECLAGTKCGENEICRNTVGNYTCDCIGGYGKEAGKCIKLTGVSFVLSAEWHITAGFNVNNQPDTPDNRDCIKKYLTVKLNGSVEGFVDIEIVSIAILTINNTNSNRVRRTPGNQLLSVVYIFHLVNYTMDKTILSVQISEKFDTTPPNVTGIKLENIKPQTQINEDGLCSLPGRTECDLGSTVCRDSSGSYACDCKHGFERKQQSILNLCNDVNECLNTSYVDQCTTHGGVCQNLYGSWNCTCPLDTLWMDVGTEETPIYRCQKNHTYVGNVTFVSISNITEDDIRGFVTKKLNMALSNSTMNGSMDPLLTVKQLFVSSTITKINWKHESHSEFYEVMFTLRFGLPMATRTLQDILSSLPTRDGDIYDMHFVVFNESENKLCDFPNECEPFSTICRTENGTVECTCKDGFIKSSSPTICLDIDECTGVNQCRDGTCINTNGSYKCNCHDGYHHDGNDNITCLDVDECDSKYDGDDKCDVNSNCTNTDGSYTCTCHHGYRLMSNGYQCEGMRVENAVTVRCNDFGWDVRINMNTLRQLVPDAKASDIYMGDNSCTGQETWNGYLHFNQELSECETYESIRHGENVYSNQLIYSEHDPIHPFIIRRFNWTISLTCTMNRNKTTSGHLHNDHLPMDVSLHSVQGGDQNDVNMTFFRDPLFSQQIESVPLHVSVGDEVYVKVFTMTSHKIRVHTCYTQPSMDSLDPLRYTLISNGCEVDPSTHILSQTIRETRFVFTEFEYTTNHEGLFVFCDVTFCNMNDSSDQCSQKCVR